MNAEESRKQFEGWAGSNCYILDLDEDGDYENNLTFSAFEAYQAAKAHAVPQWIPVSERLPDEDGTYLCLGHNGTPFVCLFRTTKYEGKIWLRSTGTRRIDGITHWMPLPSAPVKDGE